MNRTKLLKTLLQKTIREYRDGKLSGDKRKVDLAKLKLIKVRKLIQKNEKLKLLIDKYRKSL